MIVLVLTLAVIVPNQQDSTCCRGASPPLSHETKQYKYIIIQPAIAMPKGETYVPGLLVT